MITMNHPLPVYRESVQASERQSVRNARRPFLPRRSTFLTLHVLVTTVAALFLASCRKGSVAVKPDDVDYYTCTMHPSVKKQNPTDKCPICSMDLVPVKKRSVGASEGGSVGASGTPHAQHAPRSDAPTPGLEDNPSEFTVSVERQQQFGVTYATIKK